MDIFKKRNGVSDMYVIGPLGPQLRGTYEQLYRCTACGCRNECSAPVGGIGSIGKGRDILFIGRNPGKNEDKDGIPFIGRGGQMLQQFMDWANIRQDAVFITNLVKCYTTGDRPPTPEEIGTCGKLWLQREIEMIHPSLIVTFGREAAVYLTGIELKQGRMRVHNYPQPDCPLYGVMTVCCIHPGAPLHNPTMLAEFRRDADHLRGLIQGTAWARPLASASSGQ